MHTSGSGTLHTKTASNGYFKAGKKIWEWEREERVLSFFSSSYISDYLNFSNPNTNHWYYWRSSY